MRTGASYGDIFLFHFTREIPFKPLEPGAYNSGIYKNRNMSEGEEVQPLRYVKNIAGATVRITPWFDQNGHSYNYVRADDSP